MNPTELSDLYKEFKNFNSSYEARKKFYLKKNKVLDQVDRNFHSSLVEKKGTFYNDFKAYTCKNPKEAEVIIGSRDKLMQIPDLFKNEKCEEDLTQQKVCFVCEKPKKPRVLNLNEFKEISASHSRFKNKSMEKLSFITPFQSNLNERLIRKKEIQSKIDEFKHKNLNLNLDALIKTENFSKQFKEEESGFNRLSVDKAGKLSNFTTAYSSKSNVKNDNCNNNEVDCDKADKKQLASKNGKSDLNAFNNNKAKVDNDKSLNYLVFDRNKTSLSANVKPIGGPNYLLNGNLIIKGNLIRKNNSKEKKEREGKDTILVATDKEQLLKCVLEKLPNSQKIYFKRERTNETDKAEKSKGKGQSFLSPNRFTANQNVKKNNKKDENKENTASPISRYNDSFYFNNILNNENMKTNNDGTNNGSAVILSKNAVDSLPVDINLNNLNKDKISIENYKNLNDFKNSKVYLPNPLNLQNRQFDNRDLLLSRERKNNMELSHNQKKPLMQDQNAKSNGKQYKSKEKRNTNFQDKDITQNNSEPYDKRKLVDKENSNINSLIANELFNEGKRASMSSNVFFPNSDCNSHILGRMYQTSKNMQIVNLNPATDKIESNNEKNDLTEINPKEIERRFHSNKSRNSNDNTDTESNKFSNHSSFELENNIIEVKSKYGRETGINAEAGKSGVKINSGKKTFKDFNGNKINDTSSNANYNKFKNINFSEIKNAKINQTLNETVFKEVKKKIVNLNYPITEDSINELNEINNKGFSKNNFNISCFNPQQTREIQSQNNFIGKKLNNRYKSVYTPSALTINYLNSSEQELNCFSSQNNLGIQNNKHNIRSKLFVTNYYTNNRNLEPIKSNPENNSTKSFNITIYTNTNININKPSVLKNNTNLTNQDDIKGESLEPNDTTNNLPSARNTSDSKIFKSKTRIFTNRESPFKNSKIKKIFCGGGAHDLSRREHALKENELVNFNNITTKNAAGIARNEVLLEFQYPPSSSKNRSRKHNQEISINIISNNNANDLISAMNDSNFKSSNVNHQNHKVNKKMINRSSTTREQSNCENDGKNFNNLNSDNIKNNNLNADHSRISNNSNSKKTSRSNSPRNNDSVYGRKDRKTNANGVKIKETPQYFLNRNIMEEYEKIKSHTRKSSENQIIYSELKYKLDIMHENKSNFTNYLNDEMIKGNVADNNNFILPKI